MGVMLSVLVSCVGAMDVINCLAYLSSRGISNGDDPNVGNVDFKEMRDNLKDSIFKSSKSDLEGVTFAQDGVLYKDGYRMEKFDDAKLDQLNVKLKDLERASMKKDEKIDLLRVKLEDLERKSVEREITFIEYDRSRSTSRARSPGIHESHVEPSQLMANFESRPSPFITVEEPSSSTSRQSPSPGLSNARSLPEIKYDDCDSQRSSTKFRPIHRESEHRKTMRKRSYGSNASRESREEELKAFTELEDEESKTMENYVPLTYARDEVEESHHPRKFSPIQEACSLHGETEEYRSRLLEKSPEPQIGINKSLPWGDIKVDKDKEKALWSLERQMSIEEEGYETPEPNDDNFADDEEDDKVLRGLHETEKWLEDEKNMWKRTSIEEDICVRKDSIPLLRDRSASIQCEQSASEPNPLKRARKKRDLTMFLDEEKRETVMKTIFKEISPPPSPSPSSSSAATAPVKQESFEGLTPKPHPGRRHVSRDESICTSIDDELHEINKVISELSEEEGARGQTPLKIRSRTGTPVGNREWIERLAEPQFGVSVEDVQEFIDKRVSLHLDLEDDFKDDPKVKEMSEYVSKLNEERKTMKSAKFSPKPSGGIVAADLIESPKQPLSPVIKSEKKTVKKDADSTRKVFFPEDDCIIERKISKPSLTPTVSTEDELVKEGHEGNFHYKPYSEYLKEQVTDEYTFRPKSLTPPVPTKSADEFMVEYYWKPGAVKAEPVHDIALQTPDNLKNTSPVKERKEYWHVTEFNTDAEFHHAISTKSFYGSDTKKVHRPVDHRVSYVEWMKKFPEHQTSHLQLYDYDSDDEEVQQITEKPIKLHIELPTDDPETSGLAPNSIRSQLTPEDFIFEVGNMGGLIFENALRTPTPTRSPDGNR